MSEVKHVSDRSRSKIIPLEWPVTCEGVTYHAIQIVRLTAQQVADWQTLIRDLPETEHVRLPLFRTEAGEPLPDSVLDGLDDDDKFTIDEAALDFLPRRFRGIPASATAPQDGAVTAPLSNE